MALDYQDIRLSVIELPNFVTLEKLFSFKCRIVNNSERNVDLRLCLEEREGMAWCGVSGKVIKPIASHMTLDIELKAVPLIPGLQSISGIKFYDPLLKRNYPYEDLGQVFVMLENDIVSKSM